MFTGIINFVLKYELFDNLLKLYELPLICKEGDSIAVNGVCLTVIKILENELHFFIMKETFNKTYFAASGYANVEVAMNYQDKVNGHFISGHVHTTGRIISIKLNDDGSRDIWIETTQRKQKYKDSIAINGVSLTIAEVQETHFRISLIPYTYQHTNFIYLKEHDMVNIEYNSQDTLNEEEKEEKEEKYDENEEKKATASAVKEVNNDEFYMKVALLEAKKGRLTAPPNPWVGCVIVKDGKILGQGYHFKAGLSHAEVNAVTEALNKGYDIEDSEVYVTLEPCCHFGRTPPCTDLLIEHKVKRIVIGILDPDERVSGKGINKLREHGIEVIHGVLAEKISHNLRSYIHHRKTGHPYGIAKIALSLDGCYSSLSKEQVWISNEKSREHSKKLYKSCQAILVGATTFKNDYPKLKEDFLSDDAIKVIIDADGDLSAYHSLKNKMIFTRQSSDNNQDIYQVNATIDGKLNLFKIMEILGSKGILQCSVFGGALIHADFFDQGLIQEFHLYRTHHLLHGINWFNLVNLKGYQLELKKKIELDDNVFEKYQVNKSALVTKIHLVLDQVRKGIPVVIMDSIERENEGDLFVLAEKMTPELTTKFVNDGTGIICVPLTKMKANQLGLHSLTNNNEDSNHTNFTISCDLKGAKTGVSSKERTDTIVALARKETKRSDLSRPGHIFPLIAEYGDFKIRQGHTEASLVLSKLARATQVGCIVELVNPDGTMKNYDDCLTYAQAHNYSLVTIDELKEYLKLRPMNQFDIESYSQITLNQYGEWSFICYRGINQYKPHIVLIKGDIYQNRGKRTKDNEKNEVYTRVHSECFTGDVLGSKHCDCGKQLEKSLEIITQRGSGIIIFPSNHEGRSIGLINKILAYRLQTEYKLDTFEANRKLGFEDDARSYKEVKYILRHLGVKSIKLLSQNPHKIEALNEFIKSANSLKIEANEVNQQYINDKEMKYANNQIKQFNELEVNSTIDLSDMKVLIISTQWHLEHINQLVKDITGYLSTYGIKNINNIVAPGCFDSLSVIQTHYRAYDIIICCGALMKGVTDHYKYTSQGVMHGLTKLQTKIEKPIINAIFNCFNEQQIAEKCATNSGAALSFAKSTIQMLLINKND